MKIPQGDHEIMKDLSQIGKEAKDLDQRSMRERMKLEKDSLLKIGFAVIFYIIMMVLFAIFL